MYFYLLPAFRSPLSWRPLGPGWGWGGEGLLDLGGAGCHGDLHGPSVQGDSVVLLEGFDGVGPPVKDDVGGAQGTARPVVVDRGSLQVAELGEQLCDVRVADAKVQVGHDQLAWATWNKFKQSYCKMLLMTRHSQQFSLVSD